MKIERLKLIDGATGRVLRTRQLLQAEDADGLNPEEECELRQTKIWLAIVALQVVAGIGFLVYGFASGAIDFGMIVALSVLAFFASLWYGQFWLAILIFLWWLWMS